LSFDELCDGGGESKPSGGRVWFTDQFEFAFEVTLHFDFEAAHRLEALQAGRGHDSDDFALTGGQHVHEEQVGHECEFGLGAGFPAEVKRGQEVAQVFAVEDHAGEDAVHEGLQGGGGEPVFLSDGGKFGGVFLGLEAGVADYVDERVRLPAVRRIFVRLFVRRRIFRFRKLLSQHMLAEIQPLVRSQPGQPFRLRPAGPLAKAVQVNCCNLTPSDCLAFNNDVDYDLNESKVIGYKGARIEIIEATNELIKYRVLKNFNQAQL